MCKTLSVRLCPLARNLVSCLKLQKKLSSALHNLQKTAELPYQTPELSSFTMRRNGCNIRSSWARNLNCYIPIYSNWW